MIQRPTPQFFGFGSLVNTATHNYPTTRPASLAGWRRVWVATAHRSVALLSIEPCVGSEIEGLVADVPGGDWAALDHRETGYMRRDVSTHITPNSSDISAYVVTADLAPKPDASILLLSYIDVVAQGYLRVFGTQGVRGFFESTTGWNFAIQDDRADPIYPRHQHLTNKERALVDQHIANLPSVVKQR